MSNNDNAKKIFFLFATPKNIVGSYDFYIANQTSFNSIKIAERSVNQKIYVIHLYSTKITSEMNRIQLNLKTFNKNYYITDEFTINKKKDNYLFDVVFEKAKRFLSCIFSYDSLDTINIEYYDQLNIFMNNLPETNSNNNLKLYLLQDSLKLLIKHKGLHISFEFFILLFRNTYLLPMGLDILKRFNINNSVIPVIDTNKYTSIIELINKPKSFFRKSIENDSEKELLSLKLDSLVLFYQFHYNREKFIETIINSKRPQRLIDIICSNKFIGLSLKELNALQLFKGNHSKIDEILLCVTDLNVLLTFCIENRTLLLNRVGTRIIYCNLQLRFEETDNIDELIEKILKIKKDRKKEYPFLKINTKNIIQCIQDFLQSNYKRLNDILKYLYSLEPIIKIRMIKEYHEIIKKFGFRLIMNHTMTSKDIIIYLTNTINVAQFSRQDILRIAQSIIIQEIDDEFIELFKRAKLHYYLKDDYDEFIKTIIGNITEIKDFSCIIKLLQQEQMTDSMYDCFFHRFYHIVSNQNEIDNDIDENLQKLFKILILEKEYFLYLRIIDILNKIFSGKKNELLTIQLIQCILDDPFFQKDAKDFTNILEIIKYDDLFIFPENKQVLSLQTFIRKNYISETNYYTYSNIVIEKAKKDIENLSIYPIFILYFTLNPIEFQQRIKLIFYNESDEYLLLIKEKLNKALASISELNNQLTQVTQYMNFYHKKNRNYLDQLSKLNSSFINNYISYTLDNEDEYAFIKEHLKDAIKYNEFTKSKIFIILYNHYETRNINDIIINKFNSLIELFTDFHRFINNNYSMIKILFKVKATTNILMEDITFLQDFFKVEVHDIKNIIIKIDSLFLKSPYVTKVSDVLLIIDLFGAVKTEYYKRLNDYKETLNSCWEINKINELNNNDNIRSLELDNKEKDWMFDLLSTIIHKRKDLISFLQDKKEDDLQALIDYVDDDNIKESDIQDLLKVNRFINRLKDKRLNDLDLIRIFFELCNTSYFSGIDVNFLKVSENLAIFKDIYTKVIHK